MIVDKVTTLGIFLRVIQFIMIIGIILSPFACTAYTYESDKKAFEERFQKQEALKKERERLETDCKKITVERGSGLWSSDKITWLCYDGITYIMEK